MQSLITNWQALSTSHRPSLERYSVVILSTQGTDNTAGKYMTV